MNASTTQAVSYLLATQNLNGVLRFLQWGVIIIIFFMFLRIVRAVWVEMRPAGRRQTRRERRRLAKEAEPMVPAQAAVEQGKKKRKKQLYLEVMEPPEYSGQTFDLDDELTVGRSPGCGVPTTYDVYSSTLHSRLYRRGEQLWVEDLGSTNGTYVNSERITKAQRLSNGDLLQVGATVFEVTK